MKNLGLKGKLYSLSAILLFMCALTGVAGFYITQDVATYYAKIDDYNMPNMKSIISAESSNRSMRLQAFRLAMPGLSKDQRETALKKFNEDWVKYDQFIKDYLAAPFGPGEHELYEKLEPLIKTMRETSYAVVDAYKNVKDENDIEAKKILYSKIEAMDKLVGPFRQAQDDIIKYHTDSAKNNSQEAKDARAMGTKILITLVASAMGIGFVFAFYLSKSLVTSFKQISEALIQTGTEVSSASSQVASSSEELSQAVTEQATALQQTASSLEQLSSTISKNTDTSKQAANSSKRSQESASHGKNVVHDMIESMDKINHSNEKMVEQINHSNQRIADIVKVITEIGNKTKVINDIVFQTKLLSFNASVEAARAGEHGKGFAVVAEEIGNLAQMSGTAATEISSMLDSSIANVSSIVKDSQEKVTSLMSDVKTKVASGTSTANECEKVFNQIYEEITIINGMSGEISTASAEQSSGVQEISRAMNQLDSATHQNSSVAQQAASAAEQLSAQSAVMKQTVDNLIQIVEGGKKAA
jgi:methyl-accepting chemotaxis protein